MDRWREIFEVLWAHKLRTFLTALSMAWGIFVLIFLLAAGKGLQNSIEYSFRDDAVNSLWIYPGRTALPHRGLNPGRRLEFTNEDHNVIYASIPGIEHITSRFYISEKYTISYQSRFAAFEVRACHPDHQFLENTTILKGRFLNDQDVLEKRKVAVIGPLVVESLFGKQGSIEPIGKYINVGGTLYRVIGVFDDSGGEQELSKIYVPISTAQMVYHGGQRVDQIMFTLKDANAEKGVLAEANVRQLLAEHHRFSEKDQRAINVRNHLERFERVMQVFAWIRLFIWIVGLGTILAGIIGISNIMLISVRERTKEIGLRKALGATPQAILSQIMLESLTISITSGYCGLIAGLVLIELIRKYVPPNDYFRDPEADLGVVLIAFAALVIAGLLAGFFPARAAARVHPIVALRSE